MSDNSRKDQQSGSVDRRDILWKQMNVEVNKSSLKDSKRTKNKNIST